MNALRLEADESGAKVEELSSKVKSLEQENLQKEQEITSLQHKNSVLEQEVDKLENLHKDAKAAADESAQHGTTNETLQRRLQLLEEEAETNDKNLRETNEKCVNYYSKLSKIQINNFALGSAKRMSRPATTSAKYKRLSKPLISGRRNTKTWRRNTQTPRRNSTTSWRRLVTSERSSTIPLSPHGERRCSWVFLQAC